MSNNSEQFNKFREQVERKVQKFIKLELSNEFVKANKIVNYHTKLLNDIKNLLRKVNITRVEVDVDGKEMILDFLIKTRDVLDRTLIPEEIIDSCTVTSEIWYKRILEKNVTEDILSDL